jgi:OOP family OmpA-OmpF porin
VRDEPRIWAESLFPLLLPAVRIAVSSALLSMVRTLNQLLEQSLSLRSWKWRVEAWRTGKAFGEVVLLRTLVYRVEQVLLVDRRAGVLLSSVAASGVVPRDDQLISAMLTALQDFVHDSFKVDAQTGVREIHVGDFSLLVETGPRAALAAAVRGNPPAELRETLRAAIDLIHQEFAAELQNFRDDTKPFECSNTILEGCLQAQYQEKKETYSYTKLWILTAITVVALAYWIGLRVVETRRWERAITELGKAQGIAITKADRISGHYTIEGLYDPLVSRPESLLRNSGIDLYKVSLHFQPYLSLAPELVIKRARIVLDMPETVLTSLDQGTLRLAGAAPHSWILQARGAGPKLILLGIQAVEAGEVRDEDMEAIRAEIESASVAFDTGASVLTADQARAGKILSAKSRQWIDYANELGKAPLVVVCGYADPTGTDELNLILSRRRAEHLAALLVQAGIPPALLSVQGLGKSADATHEPPILRRAVIRLNLSEPVRSAR